MTISRSPPVLFVRHMFRYFGFRRETLIQYEKEVDCVEAPELGDLSVTMLDKTNFPTLMSQGLLPDSWFLSFLKKVSKGSYDRQKGAIIEECNQRMSNGDLGFVAIYEGRPAGWIWVCMSDHKYEPDLDTTIQLEPKASILYNLHIYPEYQNKRLGSRLYQYALHYRCQQDISKIVVFIEHDNLPSIKATLRLGFKPTKKLKRVQVPGYSRTSEEPIIKVGG